MKGLRSVERETFFIPLDAITIPTLVLAPDFTMIAANDSRLQVTGTKREDIIGRNIFTVFPDNPNDPLAEGVRNLRASLNRVLRDKVPDHMAIQKYDIPIPNTNPPEFEERYWSPTNIPVLNQKGEVTHILHQVEDVTSFILSQDAMAAEIYRQSEEVRSSNLQLKISKELLEQKVEERTAELHQAKESAEAASRMKSAFLANMSHEIRTPLGAIIGFTDLLKEGNLDSAERDQFLEVISRSGKALTSLIDDVLDLAKVEAGRLAIDVVDFSLYDLMSDAVELFRGKARQKGIYLLLNIDEEAPTRICSDPTRVRQILVNLIGNAIKFTNKGGVRIDLKLVSKKNESLQFKVDIKDSGIGLTEEQREWLFQPFAQADNTTTRKYGGTGLGLSLSKRLSEALGGNITISQSNPGQGSTFTFTFPATESIAVGKCDSHANHMDDWDSLTLKGDLLNNVRILAVDDSPENLFLVKRFLTKSGATVETSDNGQDAVNKAIERHYDVVLMDIQMPKMDGYQSKKALDEQGYSGPIVALTAHAMKDDLERTKSAGFSGHLTKPINREELLKTVAGLVQDTSQSHTHH